jgi:hypothetical protein
MIFGRSESRPWLTAYGLQELAHLQRAGIEVDGNRIERATARLLAFEDRKGGLTDVKDRGTWNAGEASDFYMVEIGEPEDAPVAEALGARRDVARRQPEHTLFGRLRAPLVREELGQQLRAVSVARSVISGARQRDRVRLHDRLHCEVLFQRPRDRVDPFAREVAEHDEVYPRADESGWRL